MSSKWSYLSRTTPCIGQYLEKLDNILQCHLILNLTGRPPPNETERDLFGRLGGLGIIIPSQQSDQEFKSSMLVTAPLRELIHSQDHAYALTNQISAKAEIQRERRQNADLNANRLREVLTPTLKKAMDLAKEMGSSS